MLIYRLNPQLALGDLIGDKGDGVTGLDHSREADRQLAQPLGPARGLRGDDRGHAHLQHAVRDHTRQADRLRESLVEVDRVHVTRRAGVGRDLLLAKQDLVLDHVRITNSAREWHTGSPLPDVVSVSNVTKRMPRRLMSDVIRACERTVSPTSGWLVHSNSCSAWSKRAKSTAASSSPNSCGAVAPRQYTAA